MSMTIPNSGSLSPSATNNYPPTRMCLVEAVYGNNPQDKIPNTIDELENKTDRASGNGFGFSTVDIFQQSSDPKDEVSIHIVDKTDFCPLVLGWVETTVHEFDPNTTEEFEADLSTLSPLTFPQVDDSSFPYTYQDDFKVWRKV